MLDKDIEFSKLNSLAKQTETNLLKSVNLFLMYMKAISYQKIKNHTLSFILEDKENTLTDTQIDEVIDRLINAFEQKLGAEVKESKIQFLIFDFTNLIEKHLVIMKKVAIILAMMFVGIISQAQESVVKISGLDAFGMYEVSYERTFNEGINNIKPRGRARKQAKWPNILTKGSMQYSLSFFSSKHDQTFGAGMTAVIDTNSNHDPGNLVSGTQVVANPLEHSVSRLATTTISGFGLGVEYRSYIKTYEQKIGDKRLVY